MSNSPIQTTRSDDKSIGLFIAHTHVADAGAQSGYAARHASRGGAAPRDALRTRPGALPATKGSDTLHVNSAKISVLLDDGAGSIGGGGVVNASPAPRTGDNAKASKSLENTW